MRNANCWRSYACWQGGGDMIRSVSIEHTEFADPPQRFEAGTPPIAAAVGLAAAIDLVQQIGWPRIETHDRILKQLCACGGLRKFRACA